MWERRCVYRFLVGRSEKNIPSGRPTRRDNMNMDIQEVGFGGMDWIDLAQERGRWQAPLNAVINLRSS